jgi:hypothetical protein
MGQALSASDGQQKGQVGKNPGSIGRELDDKLRAARNGLRKDPAGEKVYLDPDFLPVVAEIRPELMRRVKLIAKELEVRDRRVVGGILSKMFMSFDKDGKVDEAQARTRVNAFVATLGRDYAPWVIAEACGRFQRGQVAGHNSGFAPTAPQIALVCEIIVSPLRDEGTRIAELLRAGKPARPPPDSEERARVLKQMAEFRGEIAKSVESTVMAKGKADEPPDPFAPYRVKREPVAPAHGE